MDNIFSPLLEFISVNRSWAPLVVFLLAFGETVAFVSLFLPSTAILIGVGALVAAGSLDFWPVFVAGAAGAISGSTISYALGHRYGPAMLASWPLNRDRAMVARGSAAFARWGAWAVLAGHFVGPLRAVAFIAAGFSRMRSAQFMAANIPGAIAWAYLIPKSGEMGADATGDMLKTLGLM